jgi:hypothetical protein
VVGNHKTLMRPLSTVIYLISLLSWLLNGSRGASVLPNRSTPAAHLYRFRPGHSGFEVANNLNSLEYLHSVGNVSRERVKDMSVEFPPLASLSTINHIAPKLAFLFGTILADVDEDQQRCEILATEVPHI